MWSVNWDYWQKQHTEENPDFHIVTKRVWEETTGGQAVVEVVAEIEQHQYIASAVASGIARILSQLLHQPIPLGR